MPTDDQRCMVTIHGPTGFHPHPYRHQCGLPVVRDGMCDIHANTLDRREPAHGALAAKDRKWSDRQKLTGGET